MNSTNLSACPVLSSRAVPVFQQELFLDSFQQLLASEKVHFINKQYITMYLNFNYSKIILQLFFIKSDEMVELLWKKTWERTHGCSQRIPHMIIKRTVWVVEGGQVS